MISRGIFVHCDKPKQKKVCGDGGGDLFYCCLVGWFGLLCFNGILLINDLLVIFADFFKHSPDELSISE